MDFFLNTSHKIFPNTSENAQDKFIIGDLVDDAIEFYVCKQCLYSNESVRIKAYAKSPFYGNDRSCTRCDNKNTFNFIACVFVEKEIKMTAEANSWDNYVFFNYTASTDIENNSYRTIIGCLECFPEEFDKCCLCSTKIEKSINKNKHEDKQNEKIQFQKIQFQKIQFQKIQFQKTKEKNDDKDSDNGNKIYHTTDGSGKTVLLNLEVNEHSIKINCLSKGYYRITLGYYYYGYEAAKAAEAAKATKEIKLIKENKRLPYYNTLTDDYFTKNYPLEITVGKELGYPIDIEILRLEKF